MVRIEDECVSCGLPCLGDSCVNRNVRRYYCDDCGEDVETLYHYDGEQLCEQCVLKRLEIVTD